jgi:hypothetical protein
MRLRDWEPKDWYKIKNRLADTVFDGYELVDKTREAILSELEKKSISFQHSCSPLLSGYKVKDPTLIIEPPMYLINLGEPLK